MPRTSRRRSAAGLALGSAVSGLFAYLVFALSTRGLGAEAAGPVSVLWTYWAFAGAALTFPLQHWIARSVETHGEGSVRRVLPHLWLGLVGGSLLAGALVWVVREPLFHRRDLWFPAMVAAVTVGSAAIGMLRGGLSARDRFGAVAWSLVAENAVRCAAAGALLLAGDRHVVHYGLCLVAGHLVVLLWPSALRFGVDRTSTEAPNPFTFLAGAGLAQLIGQCVLTGGPVLLALAGGSPRQVTTLFAALALFRAPYMLALGMVAQLTARIARLALTGRLVTLHRLRSWVRLATAGLVVLAAAGGAWLGPWALRLVFGSDVVLSAGLTSLVAVGCTVAVVNLVLMVSALAQGRSTGVARAWVLGVLVAALAFLTVSGLPALSGITTETATVCCFLTAELVAFGVLSVVEQRHTHWESEAPAR